MFVLVPIFLILTVGNGWKDIKNAATLVDEDGYQYPLRSRIFLTIVTVLSFVPGLSWFPSHLALLHFFSNDNSIF